MLEPISDKTIDYKVSLVYATSENFTGKPVYREKLHTTYLHTDAVKLFFMVVEQAKQLGLRIKIWDAVRPVEAQQILWDHVRDEKYVSHPLTGDRPHCRGVALDLTLTDMAGNELEMGTGFDDFSTKAHQHCLTISSKAQQNRMLLTGIMHSCGFVCHPFEWWHFQLDNMEKYPVLTNADLPSSMMP